MHYCVLLCNSACVEVWLDLCMLDMHVLFISPALLAPCPLSPALLPCLYNVPSTNILKCPTITGASIIAWKSTDKVPSKCKFKGLHFPAIKALSTFWFMVIYVKGAQDLLPFYTPKGRCMLDCHMFSLSLQECSFQAFRLPFRYIESIGKCRDFHSQPHAKWYQNDTKTS